MSNYAEDYRQSTFSEKIWILRQIYKTATKEDKQLILEEVKKLCNKQRGS